MVYSHVLICLNMDKWALRGHFYSYVDLVWSLYNIGPCYHLIVLVVFWVKLPVQRRHSVRFSLNHGSRKKGHDGVVSGYSTSTPMNRAGSLSRVGPKIKPAAQPFFKQAWVGLFPL